MAYGFSTGRYIRVFSFKDGDSGKSGTVAIGISAKNKETGEYESRFSHNFVRICGRAYNKIKAVTMPPKGVRAKILECDVTGKGWDKEEKKVLPYNFVIWDIAFEGDKEFESDYSASHNPAVADNDKPEIIAETETIELDADDLPF